MTYEEMAEEYTAKNGFGSDCNNLTSYDANKEIEQAFLAGLKAGRPQWHKVADGDLPDEGTYLVVWQNNKGYKEIFIMEYEEDDEEELHWVDGDCENQDEYIIAWCEIPTFDKE